MAVRAISSWMAPKSFAAISVVGALVLAYAGMCPKAAIRAGSGLAISILGTDWPRRIASMEVSRLPIVLMAFPDTTELWKSGREYSRKTRARHQERRKFLSDARATPPPIFGLMTNSSTVTPESST